MIRIDLDPDEAETLREVLSSDLSELGYEIANTDGHDFKEMLRAKQAILRRIIEHLGS